MATFFTRQEYDADPENKALALRSLLWRDHGALRKLYDNTHQVSHEMWRSFQPNPSHVKKWAEMGIRTVINLRGLRNHEQQPPYHWLEEDMVTEAGMDFRAIRAHSREAPRKEFILGFAEMLEEIAYPAVLHCKSGADRAGMGASLYRFLRCGDSVAQAKEQLSLRYGHVKSGKPGVLDYFWDVYADVASTDGVTPDREHFLTWVKERYDPGAVTANFTPAKWGTLVTDVILRRE